MEVVGGKDESSTLCPSSSGQKCERALAIKVEDVRPWGDGAKFSAAYFDVSFLALADRQCNLSHMLQTHICIEYALPASSAKPVSVCARLIGCWWCIFSDRQQSSVVLAIVVATI